MNTSIKSLKACATIATLMAGLFSPGLFEAAIASRLPSGRVVFDRSPELVQIVALASLAPESSQVQIRLTVPSDAGEPLEALLIRPRDGEANLAFDPAATVAFVGKTASELASVPLTSVGGIPIQANEVLVVFASPVEPGNQVTVLLTNQIRQAVGSYELGITAYPAGDDPVGQFLGYDLVQF